MNQSQYEDLTIQDDFMFKKVMQCKRICMRLISEIMQVEVRDITYLETEKTIEAYIEGRGIRLDVLVADEKGTHYNIEMQVRNTIGTSTGKALLPKRTRYYQGSIDTDMLQKGQNFDELPPLVLIFICAFDLFNQDRYLYEFKSRCTEDYELVLDNEVTVMFLNALGHRGNVSQLVKNFLQYVNDHVPKDDFTNEVEDEVVRLNHDKEVRREFMVLSTRLKDAEMIGREEGRVEGRVEGKEEKAQEVAINMLKDDVSLNLIERYSNLSEAEIRSIAQANGLEVKE